MIVVALIGIIAAIAVVSMRRTRSTNDSDAWASTLRNMVAQARARAISTKQVYMIDLRGPTPSSAQWCQVTVDASTTCSLTSGSGCPSPITTCPNATTGAENGDIVYAPADAATHSTANVPDISQPGQTYAVPAHATTTIPDQIYFGPTGTVDALYTNVAGLTGLGFTIYVYATNHIATTTSQNQMRRRVVIYGPSGRGRILDNWQ
ncbi:MAG TPA: hypothetical protein VIA18_32870 [Polyangia bacterium]|nr:hypothetical protein [Polyangia bacterium]